MTVTVSRRDKTGWDVTLTVHGTKLAGHEMAAVEGLPGIGPAAIDVATSEDPDSDLATNNSTQERTEIATRLARCSPA
ncbi:MAG: hypothetical protein ACRDSN_17005, partial [Pseudonocardiaceae bacterium]